MTSCLSNQSCPFQYYCQIQTNVCQHYSVFPLRLYPSLIYLLIPFAMTICNLGGLAGGPFKVIIFMNLLNYKIHQATLYIYIVIAGGALGNILSLVRKKHPQLKTCLIDYNLVLILMPGVLFGTILGVLLNRILNSLIEDILVLIFLIIFVIGYFKKWRQLRQQRIELVEQNSQKQQKEQKKQKQQKTQSQQNMKQTIIIQSIIKTNQTNNGSTYLKQRQKNYQQGNHYKQIIFTFLLFTVLIILSNLAQGKIIPFQICSQIYWVALLIYTFISISTLILIYLYILSKLTFYKSISFQYPFQLSNKFTFIKIAFSGFIAGLSQGLMGLGSGSIIVFTLLSEKASPIVASAVSGYIIFFTGTASFMQAISIGELGLKQSLIFLSLSFSGSLFITQLIRRRVGNRKVMDRLIILIILIICMFGLVGVIQNMVLNLGGGWIEKRRSFCEK